MKLERILCEIAKGAVKDVVAELEGEEAVRKRKEIKREKRNSAIQVFLIAIGILILIIYLAN